MLSALACAAARRRIAAMRRLASSVAADKGPVGIVMLNMGGPSSLDGPVDGVGPFLHRLFSDGEIIRLGPLQDTLGPWIAKRRTPRIIAQYAAIGGKSPIGDWTRLQAEAMVAKLHEIAPLPDGRQYRAYTAFRYAPPLTEDALRAMEADGVTRAVAFSQYPHFSCTTTGSSLNHLWRESIRLGLEKRFTWSVLDRWPTHPTFLRAVARRVAAGLARFHPSVRDRVVILFSAHSVPMLTVNKGDQYVQEVAATVSGVMDILRHGGVAPAVPGVQVSATSGEAAAPLPPVRSPYILSWQSKVGFLPWMGPPTGEVIKGLAAQGHKYVLAVPIAFTSDHIETLFEIDQEYAVEAKEAGIAQFERAPSLNDEPLISTAQAELVAAHLAAGTAVASPQYSLNCAGCTNPACRTILNPVAPYAKLRDCVDSAEPAPGAPFPGVAVSGCAAVPGSPWPSAAETASLKARGEACK